jgi:hypothetical protein
MSKTIRSLWQVLLITSNSKRPVQLSCEECFALLNYDADLLLSGVSLDDIRPAVRYHLSLCPNCQTRFDDWLDILESNPREHSKTDEKERAT